MGCTQLDDGMGLGAQEYWPNKASGREWNAVCDNKSKEQESAQNTSK
jgi:hypothetical protein